MNDFQLALTDILFANTASKELPVERVVELATEIAPYVLEAVCKKVDAVALSTRYIKDKCKSTIDERYEAYRQGVEDTLLTIKGEKV